MTPSLQDELRQTRPFRSLEQEAYLSVVRTAVMLNDRLDPLLKPSGITLTQYNVLRILRGAEPNGLCRNEVRDRMVTRMPDMTRMLDRMEEAGLVKREADADDGRMVRTLISAKGRRTLDHLDDAIDAEHGKSLGHVGRAKLHALIEILRRLRESD